MPPIDDAIARLSADPYETTTHLVVLRDGETLAAHAFTDRGLGEPVELFSITKSVLSTVVMLAVRDGALSLEDTVGALLGDRVPPARRDATIRHLLTMSGGSESGPFNVLDTTDGSWLPALFDRPRVAAPGEVFAYDDWAAHLLATAVHAAIGDAEAYAAKRIFTPLGIDRWTWWHDPDGVAVGGVGLRMSALDLGKLGEAWRIDALGLGALLAEATSEQIKPPPPEPRGYGHLFWTEELAGRPAYMAAGWAGQHIYVVPDAALTLVATADHRRWRPDGGDNMDVLRDLARTLAG